MRSEKHNAFNDKVNKIELNSDDDKVMKLISSIERYAYGTNKEIIHREEKRKCN